MRDDALALDLPESMSRAARASATRRRIVTTTATGALFAAIGLGAATVGPWTGHRPSDGTLAAPTPDGTPSTPGALRQCADADTDGGPAASRLRDLSQKVFPAPWQVLHMRELPLCSDGPDLPESPTRTKVLAGVTWAFPAASGQPHVVELRKTSYAPATTRAEVLRDAAGPPEVERDLPGGGFVVVYLNRSQHIRIAVAVRPDGTTVTADVPPEGDPMTYGLTADEAARLVEVVAVNE
jgi:hypothetical protein